MSESTQSLDIEQAPNIEPPPAAPEAAPPPPAGADPSGTDDDALLQSAVGDTPSKKDALGFTPYVEAVCAFLTAEATKPPLTLSIEGEWGSGKSSFMLQLEAQLKEFGRLKENREAHTIRFNAWRHDKEDALCAAFALEFVRQLSLEMTPLERYAAAFRLLRLRLGKKDSLDNANSLIRPLLVAGFAILGLCAAIIIFFWQGNNLIDVLMGWVHPHNQDAAKDVLHTGGAVGLTSILLTLAARSYRYVKIPLKFDLEKFVENPNYANRLTFVERFHEDFQKVVQAYSQGKKIYVFIDDIDRCEAPRAADLMQGINLMLTDLPQIIFVLGMDREKVAASLAVKHEKLLPYLAPSRLAGATPSGAVAAAFDPIAGMEYGYSFIEKFVQVPFRVPRPVSSDIDCLLDEMGASPFETSAAPSAPSEASAQALDAKFKPLQLATRPDSPSVRAIVKKVAPALDYNPRRIKQFISLFRLRAHIAYNTGLFDADDGKSERPLTLEMLAKLVVINLQWPMLVSAMEEDGWLLSRLQFLAGNRDMAQEGGAALVFTLNQPVEEDSQKMRILRWLGREDLLAFLRIGVSAQDGSGSSDSPYSFANYNVEKFMQISPAA